MSRRRPVGLAVGVTAWMAALAPLALAGGIPVEAIATGRTLWTTSDAGVLELDARSGQVLARPRAALPWAPIRIAVGGGAVWVASAESGYGAGALTRIDLRTGRETTRLRRRGVPVFDVAVGGGFAWALVGPTDRAQVARVDLRSGRQVGVVRGVSQPVSLAAAASGVWVVEANGLLAHAPPGLTAHPVARFSAAGMPSAGLGSVWVPDGTTVVRVDEARERIVARIPVGGSTYAVAARAGSAWGIVSSSHGSRNWLVHIDAHTNTIVARRSLPSGASSVSVDRKVLWVGVGGYAQRVLRVDPHTLAVRELAQLL